MKIGYARVSKSDGLQVVDLQTDALIKHGVDPANIYTDHTSGKGIDKRSLEAYLKALRKGD